MEKIDGIIDKYLYFNKENNYSVLKLKEGDVVVGYLPKLKPNSAVVFEGEWTNHNLYGLQFKAVDVRVREPSSVSEISSFLASGILKGVNKILADRIVAKFGERTIEILNSSPERLIEINGIGKKKLKLIIESWRNNALEHEVMFYLNKRGITGRKAIKIYREYGEETIDIIEENPYRLVFDIEGIGFKTADEIASKIGFGEHHPFRIKAWVIYYLAESAGKAGDVFLPENKLYNACRQKLGFALDEEPSILNELEEDEFIVRDESRIYLTDYYRAERKSETLIKKLISARHEFINVGADILKKWKDLFSERQLKAINSAVNNNITIITGGPGTGKTTAIKGIIDIYKDNKKKILLAAPTGRAAKRMNELIGLEASTIHRMLEFNPVDYSFFYNEENNLNADLIIVDEVSMIDIFLFYHLLSAIKPGAALVLVGDSNQLPPVGAGNVLKDLIESGIIPVIKLEKIFRQAESSGIIRLAHSINKGMPFLFENKPESDVWFVEVNNNSKISSLVVEIVKKRLPNKYGYEPVKDIQVISPMYRGPAGVNELNRFLQSELNGVNAPLSEINFKTGDKVMQLRNDYRKNVFNGDIGFVTEINSAAKKLKVYFDFKIVEYKFDELEDLTLAYAVTVHKSQGSEYPCVVMVVANNHRIMLRRKLIYTAVTRAREMLVLVGSRQAFDFSVKNTIEDERYSWLLKNENPTK